MSDSVLACQGLKKIYGDGASVLYVSPTARFRDVRDLIGIEELTTSRGRREHGPHQPCQHIPTARCAELGAADEVDVRGAIRCRDHGARALEHDDCS